MGERDWSREIPDDIKFEILKRLPAKSLMRFKCVCKTWRAIIEDRFFAQQHHVESKSRRDASYMLLFVDEETTCKESIIPVNYSAVCTTDIAGLKLAEYYVFTDEVEGLACIGDKNGKLNAMNVTTGEKLCLPPRVKMQNSCNKFYFYPRYFLGFDPLNNNYKLLYFRLKINICQILTLGESSWRKIDPVSDEPLTPEAAKFIRTQKGVSVNGAIYWIRGPSVINYFDVHAEKFMQLDLPHGVGWILQLTRVGDKLGLLCKGTEWPVLWTLSPTQVWKMQEMTHLNRDWIDKFEIIGTTRAGEFLSKPKEYSPIPITRHDPFCKVPEISLTSYDPTSNSEGKMLIKITHPWDSSRDPWLFRASCDHVENILPLKTL